MSFPLFVVESIEFTAQKLGVVLLDNPVVTDEDRAVARTEKVEALQRRPGLNLDRVAVAVARRRALTDRGVSPDLVKAIGSSRAPASFVAKLAAVGIPARMAVETAVPAIQAAQAAAQAAATGTAMRLPEAPSTPTLAAPSPAPSRDVVQDVLSFVEMGLDPAKIRGLMAQGLTPEGVKAVLAAFSSPVVEAPVVEETPEAK